MTYHFSKRKEAKIAEGFKNGASLRELVQKFGYSSTTIKRVLIEELGLETYKKITKKHKLEHGRKLGLEWGLKIGKNSLIKWQEEYPEELKEHARKVLANWKREHPEELAERGRKAIRQKYQASQKAHPSIYEKGFKKALEDENISFEWQEVIDFPERNFNKFAVVDFLINKNLIIEIDGSSHQIDPSYDIQRDEICLNLGYTIFRFSHEDIKNHLNFYIDRLKEVIYYG